MNTKKKISLILAVLMSVSLLATGCKKTDEDTAGLPEATTTTSMPELTQMTTAAPETTTAAPETEATTVPETEETTVSESEETTVSETEETTAAETTTAASETTASETTTTAVTTVKKEWNETEISEVMYTSQACYSRVKPVVGSDPVSQYKKGTKVNVVAATDTGYYKLADGSFIHSDYLVEEKPAVQTTTAAPDDEEEIFDDDNTGEVTEKPDDTPTQKPVVTDTSDYKSGYAYKTLTSAQKELYDRIYKAISNFETKVTVPDGILTDDVIKVYGMIFNQEPQLFWMSITVPKGYGTLTIKYDMTADEAAAKQKQIDKNVNSILATAAKSKTTAGKLKVFYDWIVLNNTFSLSETSATSSIANGLTGSVIQCAGYAKSMQYLCDKAGIESMVVVGRNRHGSSHAWNVIYVDDGYYILDTAWGDPEGAPGGGKYIRYSFFLVPDAWTKTTHYDVNKYFKPNGDTIKYFDPPACTKTTYNYYKIYGKLYSDLSSAEKGMYEAFDEAIKNGKFVAEIRVTDESVYNKLMSDDYAKKFQSYAKEKGSVSKLSRQKADNEGALIVQYNIVYK